MTTRRAMGHKYTAKCPKCKYTSRIPITDFHLTNKNSVHSKLCPVHRLELVRVVYEIKSKSKGL
jgi:hypothetical protein